MAHDMKALGDAPSLLPAGFVLSWLDSHPILYQSINQAEQKKTRKTMETLKTQHEADLRRAEENLKTIKGHEKELELTISNQNKELEELSAVIKKQERWQKALLMTLEHVGFSSPLLDAYVEALAWNLQKYEDGLGNEDDEVSEWRRKEIERAITGLSNYLGAQLSQPNTIPDPTASKLLNSATVLSPMISTFAGSSDIIHYRPVIRRPGNEKKNFNPNSRAGQILQLDVMSAAKIDGGIAHDERMVNDCLGLGWD